MLLQHRPCSLCDPSEQEALAADQRAKEKLDRRRARKEQEELLEELAPKATGREAMIEKKLLRRAERKAREDSPEMKESDVLGGGDDFEARWVVFLWHSAE